MTPRFDAVGLVTDDMAASLAFYRRLGLDLPAEADGQPHAEAELPGGTRMLWDTADSVRSFDPGWTPPKGGHRIGLAFLCDSPAAVDAAYAEFAATGHGGLEPWDAPWGQRYACLTDPDGNGVDLFAPLPTTG
ncbi:MULTISPECIES: VOC family protein [Streptomyces]|uniref:Glyoxalase n=1 Tax=Streptomyces lycii TaxID=2654337 RepID=A0ABQ7FI51_9ACTN|nr:MULTISPECIES: VOC family protein [Streptomyces]KAF4408597.1 glyoxalase [Streptomyces lycii]PGH49730.1 glyoxalase [Streptomyces sp. Ru87]